MFIETKRVLSVLAFAAVAAMGFAGCGADLGSCPTDSTASAQKSAGNEVINKQCATAGCHSSSNGGNPAAGLEFSSSSSHKTHAVEMYSEASEGAMPPTGALSDTDLEAMRVYLACTQ
jgi:uncharacterized membrane protein